MFRNLTSFFSDPTDLLYSIPAILIGLTVHEWAHAFAAYKLGDTTARDAGRLTLNPFAHIDPIGLICLLLFRFGWAKPVPVSPRHFKNFKRDDIIVSLAGITMNLITAFIALILYYAFLFNAKGLYNNEAFHAIMTYLIVTNLSLAVFNLIPLYPLDGSHVLQSLLFRKIPKVCMFLNKYGYYILLGLMITGVLSPAISKAVSFLYSGFSSAAFRIVTLFIR